MASRIIHLAVISRVAEKRKFKDIHRLRLGTLLPDAGATSKVSVDSHFKVVICGGSKKTFDLNSYKKIFGERMKSDDLYLGYYCL